MGVAQSTTSSGQVIVWQGAQVCPQKHEVLGADSVVMQCMRIQNERETGTETEKGQNRPKCWPKYWPKSNIWPKNEEKDQIWL